MLTDRQLASRVCDRQIAATTGRFITRGGTRRDLCAPESPVRTPDFQDQMVRPQGICSNELFDALAHWNALFKAQEDEFGAQVRRGPRP